jgi:hypothetical protein
MKARARKRIRLVDAPDEPGRTTATLLASLAARLASLYAVSGADAIGAVAAGLARIGREAGQTAEGQRLRKAIESGRAGANGDLLWSRLLIGPWVSSLPPAPLLEHLRNDLALLLTPDLGAGLDAGIVPVGYAGDRGALVPEPASFTDYLLGLWAFGAEMRRAVEMLAAPGLEGSPEVAGQEQSGFEHRPGLLR